MGGGSKVLPLWQLWICQTNESVIHKGKHSSMWAWVISFTWLPFYHWHISCSTLLLFEESKWEGATEFVHWWVKRAGESFASIPPTFCPASLASKKKWRSEFARRSTRFNHKAETLSHFQTFVTVTFNILSPGELLLRKQDLVWALPNQPQFSLLPHILGYYEYFLGVTQRNNCWFSRQRTAYFDHDALIAWNTTHLHMQRQTRVSMMMIVIV